MTEEKYKEIFAYLDNHQTLKELVLFVNNWVTLITYIAYPLMIIKLLMNSDRRVIEMIVIPFVSFLIVSIVRKLVKAERPYEKYDFKPLVQKVSTQNSFPSRHVFSIFVISMGFLSVQIPLGILFLVLGILLALSRVAVGVHFPKDVIAGAAAGIVFGLAFFILSL